MAAHTHDLNAFGEAYERERGAADQEQRDEHEVQSGQEQGDNSATPAGETCNECAPDAARAIVRASDQQRRGVGASEPAQLRGPLDEAR